MTALESLERDWAASLREALENDDGLVSMEQMLKWLEIGVARRQHLFETIDALVDANARLRNELYLMSTGREDV